MGEKRTLEAEVKDLKAQLAKVKTVLLELNSYLFVVDRKGMAQSKNKPIQKPWKAFFF